MDAREAATRLQRRLRVALLDRAEGRGEGLRPLYSAVAAPIGTDRRGGRLIALLPRLAELLEQPRDLLALLAASRALLKRSNADGLLARQLALHRSRLLAAAAHPCLGAKLGALHAARTRFARGVLSALGALRAEGNALFLRGETAAAADRYAAGRFPLRQARRRLGDCAGQAARWREALRLGAVLGSNLSQCQLDRGWHGPAILAASAALTLLAELRQLHADPRRCDAETQSLRRKLQARARTANAALLPQFLFRRSNHAYPGLRPGCVLVAGARISSGAFRGAAVVVVALDAQLGALGLVYTAPLSGGLFYGGPCTPEETFALHNDGAVPLARRVADGLFLGGRVEGWAAAGFRCRLYAGIASWFPGQLDGELFGGDWQLRGDVGAAEILAERPRPPANDA